MKQFKFAEQKTETRTQDFYSKHIHIFRPWQMFHKELYKTVGAFALKGATYI